MAFGVLGSIIPQVSLQGPPQKEILFVLNGIKVGNYSQIAKILNPTEIKNITILRNASNIAFYGFNGSGGVILIDTK